MEKAPVSVVVITRNEEKRIEACLDSVHGWASEIVVVDDESTDRTLEIAGRYTARVFSRKMDREGLHRNYANSQASQPWVLSLDADERVTPELAEEITRALKEDGDKHVCYAIPMKIFIGSEWIRGAGYYPSARSKLFRKGEFSYDEKAGVHPRVFYKGTSGLLKGELLHYSFRDVEDFIRKFNRESTLEAEKWIEDGRKVSFPNILRKTFDRFFKNYFLKKGIRTGFYGYFMSVFHGLYQLVSYAKYREMKKKAGERG